MVEDVPVPEIGEGEVLIRVAACGICGTDIKKIHHGFVKPPQILGHEVAGTVVAVGRGVTLENRRPRREFSSYPLRGLFLLRAETICAVRYGYKKSWVDGWIRSEWRRVRAICAGDAVDRRARNGGDSGRREF